MPRTGGLWLWRVARLRRLGKGLRAEVTGHQHQGLVNVPTAGDHQASEIHLQATTVIAVQTATKTATLSIGLHFSETTLAVPAGNHLPKSSDF